jgi:RNA polymerase sigma-70 factor, ECF subfamily
LYVYFYEMAVYPMMKSRVSTQSIDWEAVYNEQMPRVYNFFRYRVGDEPLAEDLTAETFEKAWRARERYRSNLGAFSTWLFAIARNVATDYFRRRREEISLERIRQQTSGPSLEAMIQQKADLARLSGLLAELPARERELVALKYGAELNNREIANVTQLSASNVGTILHRVVERLKGRWEAGL